MRLLTCTALFILLSFTACDRRHIRGSGNVTTETRKLQDFRKLSVSGSMDVYFTQGPELEALIEAEDNVLPYIELREEGDKLEVRLRRNISLRTRRTIKITITAPHVEEIAMSGSGNVKLVNTLESDGQLSLNLSGSGDIEGRVNSPSVRVVSAGSGDIKLSGETKDLNVSTAGSGDFEGEDLMTEITKVNTAGSGNASVHASVKLEVNIVGSGDVRYKGSPEVQSHAAGSGSVRKME